MPYVKKTRTLCKLSPDDPRIVNFTLNIHLATLCNKHERYINRFMVRAVRHAGPEVRAQPIKVI